MRAISGIGPARILAIVGGGALLLGIAYFLSLAFSSGWIGPELRVAMGLLVGFGLLPVGGLLFDRERPTLGHVIVGVGLATIELALFASRLYELVPAEVALAGALIGALAAGYIAIRWNSQLVAMMGIALVLAAPPIVGALQNLVTVGFLTVVLVGVAVVAFRRAWPLLLWLSLLLTAPQLFVWVTADVPAASALIAIAAYWALFAAPAVLPALGDSRRDPVHSIALLGVVTGITATTAYFTFSGTERWLAGALIVALAAANLALAVGLLRRRGFNDDLAQAPLGFSAALAVAAVAILLEGSGIVIGWTLVMLAAAFVWLRFGLPRAGAAAGLIGGGVALLLMGTYVADGLQGFFDDAIAYQTIPYADPQGVALAAYLAALAAIAWLSHRALLQQYVLAGAVLLVAITVPLEASDLEPGNRSTMIAIGWGVLSFVALSTDGVFHRTWRWNAQAQPLPWAGVIVGVGALLALVERSRLLDLVAVQQPTGTPFTDQSSLLTLLFVAGLWAIAFTRHDRAERMAVVSVSVLLIAALMRQQLPLEWAVAGWSALAAAIALLGPRPVAQQPEAGVAATSLNATPGTKIAMATIGVLIVGAVIGTFALAPLSRLAVQDFVGSNAAYALVLGGGPPNAATIALVSLSLGLAAIASYMRRTPWARWLWAVVLGAGVYLVSVTLVDLFAVRVPDAASLEEVAKQAQVALTITWALMGLALLAVGLARDWFEGRAAGLGLLGLATVKAFVFDLSSLDVAYRVLSLIGLGLLLLAGAYGYQRLKIRTQESESPPG